MGLNIGTIAGRRQVSHGGNIYGFNAHLATFPDDGIAWVALANAGTGVAQLGPQIEAALFALPGDENAGAD